MSIYKREIDKQCCNQWMNGIRTINNQYPDDNREFTIIAGPGIKIEPSTAGIRITNDADPNSFIAGDNIEFVNNGDGTITVRLKDDQVRTGSTALTGNVGITGDLQVNGDIIQQGSAYETHAEKVFTTNDYITMRDGAVAALAPGDYSGFQVKKYDGINDGRLVIDNTGTARVGDVGSEQPLLTRDEAADLTNDHLLKWDSANAKGVDAGVGVNDLAAASSVTPVFGTATRGSGFSSGSVEYAKIGKLVIVSLLGMVPIATGTNQIAATGLPRCSSSLSSHSHSWADSFEIGNIWIDKNTTTIYQTVLNTNIFWQTLVYVTDE